MNDRPNARVSMFSPAGIPRCETCPSLVGGWCIEPSNRVFSPGWPDGFPPSQAFDGSCNLHPERAVPVLSQSKKDAP